MASLTTRANGWKFDFSFYVPPHYRLQAGPHHCTGTRSGLLWSTAQLTQLRSTWAEVEPRPKANGGKKNTNGQFRLMSENIARKSTSRHIGHNVPFARWKFAKRRISNSRANRRTWEKKTTHTIKPQIWPYTKNKQTAEAAPVTTLPPPHTSRIFVGSAAQIHTYS